MLAAKLVYDWATNTASWTATSIVSFCVLYICQDAVETTSSARLYHRTLWGNSGSELSCLLLDRTLFIIDGYDEMAEANLHLSQNFQGRNLWQCWVIFTSRPMPNDIPCWTISQKLISQISWCNSGSESHGLLQDKTLIIIDGFEEMAEPNLHLEQDIEGRNLSLRSF